jgi:CubicO group peptidase (beta-lactamase class C family)
VSGFASLVSPAIVAALLLTAPARGDDTELTSKLDAYMSAAVELDHFSGAVLIARDGKPVFRKGYSLANRELDVPNRPVTKFRLGSITKQFTAMAVMILERRGRLSVDDPISKHIEDAPKAWDAITIHHLLTHTSGIPNFTSFPDYQKLEPLASPPAETLKRFKDKPLEFKPGEKFAYSNSGYIVLGLIVEKAAGKSYEAFVKEAIFEPAGMKHSGYDHAEVIIENRASGYQREGDTVRNASFLDMTVPHAAGALYSTVDDMALWDRVLDSESLVPRASLKRMFTPAKDHYAYGIHVTERFGRRYMEHAGGINGFVTDMSRFPDDKVCVVVLCNMIGANPNKVCRDLESIYFGKPYEIPRRREVARIDPKVFRAYAGEYRITPEFALVVSVDDEKLMVQATNQPKVELFPESETKFFLKVVDAQVTFGKDEDGKVTHLILHQGGLDQRAKRVE